MNKMKRIILLLITFCSIQMSAQKIEKVEPANWWTDMQWSELQLLIYGDNIASLDVNIDNENFILNKTIKTINPNYIFIYVSIPENAYAGIVPIEFKKGKRVVETYNFELKERAEDAALVEGFSPEDMIYLITPDRFANGDTANDEFEDMPDKLNRNDKMGRHGGDIAGMLNSLDYISSIGSTAIWINPIIENDMETFSYHGYAATDFYKVDRRYGTNEEYVDFITKAKEKDMIVIMDMILNHSGSEHWFVLDPPMEDWINNQDNFVKTSHKRQTVQDIYASEYDKKAFSDGWFVKTMPDLNQKNPLMADYLIQNTLWWIEYSGIAGIRMDTYPYPDKDFMSDWTCAVMTEYPNFSIVGEEWTVNPAIVSYWQADKVNHDGYTSCLPSLMDFPIQHALAESLNDENESWNSGFIKLYEMLANDFLYSHPEDLVIFPDNHDMDRFFTQVNEDVDLYKMGLVYTATMRGIPQLYYGTEIAMSNTGAPRDHGIIRTDFPGGWEGDAVNAFTGEELSTQQKDILNFTSKIFNWRKNAKVVHQGNLIQFAPENGVYSYVRTFEDKQILVLLSKTKEPFSLSFNKYAEVLNLDSTGTDIISGQNINFSENFEVTPKTAYIIEIQN